jgi:hypothetical protein
MSKPYLWDFRMSNEEFGDPVTSYMCPYNSEEHNHSCKFALLAFGWTLTELHGIAREHWAEVHST